MLDRCTMKFGERPELWTWVIIFAIDEIRELRGGPSRLMSGARARLTPGNSGVVHEGVHELLWSLDGF
jgi:hypothetical protein